MNLVFLLIAAGIVILWGISHLIPTKNVAKGFGDISIDNRRIILMEWINEGFTLIFIGLIIIIMAFWGDPASMLCILMCLAIVVMLVAMAFLSVFTGARINFIPFRLCPVIFICSAILVLLGVFL